MSLPGLEPGHTGNTLSLDSDSINDPINGPINIYNGDVKLTNKDEPQYLTLSIGMQWSLELGKQDLVGQHVKIYITVLSGICEVLGTELANDIEYCFQDWNFSVLAIEDSRIKWRLVNLMIPLDDPFINNITPNDNAKYVYNLHFAIEKLRYSSFTGPKVLILGNKNTGKTSLSRILSSYSIKNKAYQPMFINLDPEQPIVSPPGCIMATPISDLIDLQSPFWNESLTSGATKLHSRQPLIKNFGFEKIEENFDWYIDIVRQMLDTVDRRLYNDLLVQRSGCIIDTPSCFYESYESFESVLNMIISKMKIDIIVILSANTDNDISTTINAEPINKIIDKNKCSVIKLPKLSGVIPNDDAYKRLLQRLAIRDYFYGDLNTVITPYVTSCDFTDLIIWELPVNNRSDIFNGSVNVGDASIPSNNHNNGNNNNTENDMSADTVKSLALQPVEVNQSNLQHAIITIYHCPKRTEPKQILQSSVMGFALITEVNEKRQRCKLLLPVPGSLPKNALVLTSYRYLE